MRPRERIDTINSILSKRFLTDFKWVLVFLVATFIFIPFQSEILSSLSRVECLDSLMGAGGNLCLYFDDGYVTLSTE